MKSPSNGSFIQLDGYQWVKDSYYTHRLSYFDEDPISIEGIGRWRKHLNRFFDEGCNRVVFTITKGFDVMGRAIYDSKISFEGMEE